MANKIPSRIKVENDKFPLFKKLKDYFSKDTYNSDIFALALAYGYKSGIRIPLKQKHDFILMSSASKELQSMVFLVGISEFGDNIHKLVENPAKMYEIAQEYANAGIDELYNDFNQGSDEFTAKLYNDLMELNENFDFNEIKEVLK